MQQSVENHLRSDCSFRHIDGIIDTLPSAVAEGSAEREYEISVLILAKNEVENIGLVLNDVRSELQKIGLTFELVVIDGNSSDETKRVAEKYGAIVYSQTEPGYAAALVEGIKRCRGRLILTLDADCSHPPDLIPNILAAAGTSQLVIGSRWMKGGEFLGSSLRHGLSRALSRVFRCLLALPVSDVSSGYRLYRRDILRPEMYTSKDFSILQEILVRAISEGYDVTEVPLRYAERRHGKSHVVLARFAYSYLRTLMRMWLIRNDAASADYDSRAYDSRNLVQRFWQRSRYKNIMSMLGSYRQQGKLLDVGCGSSRIIQHLTHAVAFDAFLSKLRALRSTNPLRVCGSALKLPFCDAAFDCVIHSQLIEHLPMTSSIFSELRRVLKPGGTAIVGTVDYGSPWWPIIEYIYGLLMPHAYADEHISHYTLSSLTAILEQNGFVVEETRSILAGEITLKAILTR